MVEVTDSEDKFAIFNQPLFLELQVGNSSHPLSVPADSTQEDTTISEKDRDSTQAEINSLEAVGVPT